MNFSKTKIDRFFSLIPLIALFLISRVFGLQEACIPEGHENQIPPLSLIGLVVSEDPSSSVAVIYNKGTGKTVTLTIGKSVLDMKLTHVLKDGIVLKKGEKIYWLFLKQSVQVRADVKTQKSPKKVEEPDHKYDESKSVGVNSHSSERIFFRSEVQKKVKREWPLIIKETQVVPNYVDGKMSGLRVVSLPKKSIASEIGIYKDDVIKAVNGVKLDNLSTLVSLYNQTFMKDRFEVLIERDKKLIRQVYTLR